MRLCLTGVSMGNKNEERNFEWNFAGIKIKYNERKIGGAGQRLSAITSRVKSEACLSAIQDARATADARERYITISEFNYPCPCTFGGVGILRIDMREREGAHEECREFYECSTSKMKDIYRGGECALFTAMVAANQALVSHIGPEWHVLDVENAIDAVYQEICSRVYQKGSVTLTNESKRFAPKIRRLRKEFDTEKPDKSTYRLIKKPDSDVGTAAQKK